MNISHHYSKEEVSDSRSTLRRLLNDRIVLLDGAIGTMIQALNLDEQDFRGDILKNHTCDVKGNLDILNITKPGVIRDIHRAKLMWFCWLVPRHRPQTWHGPVVVSFHLQLPEMLV